MTEPGFQKPRRMLIVRRSDGAVVRLKVRPAYGNAPCPRAAQMHATLPWQFLRKEGAGQDSRLLCGE
jgi:hypothetical protein